MLFYVMGYSEGRDPNDLLRPRLWLKVSASLDLLTHPSGEQQGLNSHSTMVAAHGTCPTQGTTRQGLGRPALHKADLGVGGGRDLHYDELQTTHQSGRKKNPTTQAHGLFHVISALHKKGNN